MKENKNIDIYLFEVLITQLKQMTNDTYLALLELVYLDVIKPYDYTHFFYLSGQLDFLNMILRLWLIDYEKKLSEDLETLFFKKYDKMLLDERLKQLKEKRK